MHGLNHAAFARALQDDRERELAHARLVREAAPPRPGRAGALLRVAVARLTRTPLPRDRR